MEEALRALIKTIVPSTVSVDWGARPRGAPLPGIVLMVVSDRAAVRAHDGPSALSEARVQVDLYADTYGQAKTLARTLRAALDGYKSPTLGPVFLDLQRDFTEAGDAPDARIYRAMTDLKVWYSRA